MQKVHEGGSPHGFARKMEERRVQNLAPSWGPQVLHKSCEENREKPDGSVWATFWTDFDEKTMMLEVRRRLAAGWGRVSKELSEKTHFDAKGLTHLGAFFRKIRLFPTLYFSVLFEVTSEAKLYAPWCQKGAQKEVFG